MLCVYVLCVEFLPIESVMLCSKLFIFVVCISNLNLRYWLILYVCRVSGLAVFCLQGPKKKDAEKQLQTLAVSSFDIPGDRGFPLNEFYAKPSGRSEEGKYITDTYLKLFIRKLFIQTKLHTSTKMTSRLTITEYPVL